MNFYMYRRKYFYVYIYFCALDEGPSLFQGQAREGGQGLILQPDGFSIHELGQEEGKWRGQGFDSRMKKNKGGT